MPPLPAGEPFTALGCQPVFQRASAASGSRSPAPAPNQPLLRRNIRCEHVWTPQLLSLAFFSAGLCSAERDAEGHDAPRIGA